MTMGTQIALAITSGRLPAGYRSACRHAYSVALVLCLIVTTGMWSSSCTNELNDEEVQTLVRWIECEKCDEADFIPVAALGERAADTLVVWIMNGPPAGRMDRYRNRLIRNYRQIQTYVAARRQVSFGMSELDYVALYAETYVARYQYRAARALAQIGGPRARSTLDSASRAGLRPDVTGVIELLRDSLPTP